MADEKVKKVSVPTFAVQADHPRNCDLLFQSIPNLRLRSTVMAGRTVERRTSDGRIEHSIPADQAIGLSAFPQIPGQILAIDPAKLEIKVFDPLTKDPDMCERIKRALDDKGLIKTDIKITGVPTRTENWDEHRIKTLCREVVNLIKIGHVKMVDGPTPDIEDVKELPGKFLLNPNSPVELGQPRYEDDFPAWVDRLHTRGG